MNEQVIVPVPDEFSGPYWAAARQHKLSVQCCDGCGHYQHPPGPVCRNCFRYVLNFTPVSGRGVIYSYTCSSALGEEDGDYFVPIVLIELEEQSGLRVLANLLDVEPGEIAVGLRVEVAFEDVSRRTTLPQFRIRVEEGMRT